MALEMVFNELSGNSPAPNIPVAQQWMQQFIDMVRAAQKLDIKTLRIHSSFNQSQLASNYTIAQWRNDGTVDLELRRFFKSLQTKSPFIDIHTESALLEQTELSEFFHAGDKSDGLGVAYLLEALAVSLPSAPHWQKDCVYLDYSFVDPDTANFRQEKVTIPHASEKQHLAAHYTWIQEQTCLQLWTTEDEIVPCYSNAAGDKL